MSWGQSYGKALGFLISPSLLIVLPPLVLPPLPPSLQDLCPLSFIWTQGSWLRAWALAS